MSLSDLCFWLADNVETWKPYAIGALSILVLVCLIVAEEALAALSEQ